MVILSKLIEAVALRSVGSMEFDNLGLLYFTNSSSDCSKSSNLSLSSSILF